MSVSDAQINANRQNSAKSTGPKTPEGKDRSRENAYKHGLAGAGVVMSAEEAAEVEERFVAFRQELRPTGSLGITLVRRAASLAVRMEKCSERDLSTTAERVARAMVEFEAPAGVDASEALRLRAESGRVAAFDSSKEGCLARRYEAAAERGFYRALKELRLVEKQAAAHEPAREADSLREILGSFREMKNLEASFPEIVLPSINNPFNPAVASPLPTTGGRVDVPFSIGRAR